jgi:CspA family cold shock protein
MSNNRVVGVCKWFDDQKGYGFIDHEDIEEDIFVHYSQINQDGFKKLDEGDRVEFEAVDTDDGIQAHDTILIGSDEGVEEVAA